MSNKKILAKIIFMSLFLMIVLNILPPVFAAESNELSLYCNADIAMDAESGNILYAKDIHKKVFPASTTKILTAILAIENLDMNEPIVASKNAVYSTPADSSLMYVKVGEILTIKELLYGLMLPSGNDAANVIAEAVSGKISDFVALMNEKLKEIGCNESHFTNAHGFHDNNHYTTAYDMAKLMKYAMQYDIFREVIETKYIELPATNKSEVRKLENTNRMFDKSYPQMYYEYILGGKTGYTEEARGTFVGYAKKDDKLVIVGAFDGSQNINKQQGRFLDSIVLLNYSFDNYTKKELINKENKIFDIKDKSSNKLYKISPNEDINALLPDNDAYISTDYTLDVDFQKLESEQLKVGDSIGKINININGKDTGFANSYNLVYISSEDYYEPISIFYYIPIIIAVILGLILILLIISFIKRKNKNKRKIKKLEYKYENNYKSRNGNNNFKL